MPLTLTARRCAEHECPQSQHLLQSPPHHALNTDLWKTYSVTGTVLGAGGTEMSKTRFLPPRSSQSTEGDRHRNKQSRNSVAQVWRSLGRGLHKVSWRNRGRNDKFCPERVHRHSTLVLSFDNTSEEARGHEQSAMVGKDAGAAEW